MSTSFLKAIYSSWQYCSFSNHSKAAGDTALHYSIADVTHQLNFTTGLCTAIPLPPRLYKRFQKGGRKIFFNSMI